MNGIDHYGAAQRLLSDASFVGAHGHPVTRDGGLVDNNQHRALIARAQVHAMLALAAATALSTVDKYVGDGPHINLWRDAVGHDPADATTHCPCSVDGTDCVLPADHLSSHVPNRLAGRTWSGDHGAKLVVEEPSFDDGRIELWLAHGDMETHSVRMLPAHAREIAADLAHRAEIINPTGAAR
ncbi:hypothetical protein [Alloactinosynnema sp. L-07]|uniref:hypothetical protein n=1 Tax=Alloactinosynnema sp. L-07 TaxID=1653480 RepID=UPI00065EFA37|nr:hypothetical protein [Alloactinosynnema sp. L-07]CRK59027.1 hypothetical protein [Alloactinosynnema sp. L-07]